jgi:integrase
MNKTKLLNTYAKNLSSSGKTRNLYLRFVRDFLDECDSDFDRQAIESHMDSLRKKGYSDGTINLRFRAIRTMANRNKIEWPFQRGDAPQIREDTIQAPALHPNTILHLIEAVKSGGDETERDPTERATERAFLALSTTYGLRKIEMSHLEARDVNIIDRTIHIMTAKHGRERTHLIPEAILPYLEEHDFSQTMSEFKLFCLWHRIEARIAMKHIERVNWHSIRRTLDTLLLRQLPETDVMSFMRWKQRTSSHMPFRYSAIKFVGEEGETTEVIGEALDVDSRVFAVHPFIEHWR